MSITWSNHVLILLKKSEQNAWRKCGKKISNLKKRNKIQKVEKEKMIF